ncbi:hypothetical protein MP228_010791 [Amoeboaphelidium protococcarum]|nr:hypothetical protein MP228_010791 [Amoeboaphelidium protococcarum]
MQITAYSVVVAIISLLAAAVDAGPLVLTDRKNVGAVYSGVSKKLYVYGTFEGYIGLMATDHTVTQVIGQSGATDLFIEEYCDDGTLQFQFIVAGLSREYEPVVSLSGNQLFLGATTASLSYFSSLSPYPQSLLLFGELCIALQSPLVNKFIISATTPISFEWSRCILPPPHTQVVLLDLSYYVSDGDQMLAISYAPQRETRNTWIKDYSLLQYNIGLLMFSGDSLATGSQYNASQYQQQSLNSNGDIVSFLSDGYQLKKIFGPTAYSANNNMASVGDFKCVGVNCFVLGIYNSQAVLYYNGGNSYSPIITFGVANIVQSLYYDQSLNAMVVMDLKPIGSSSGRLLFYGVSTGSRFKIVYIYMGVTLQFQDVLSFGIDSGSRKGLIGMSTYVSKAATFTYSDVLTTTIRTSTTTTTTTTTKTTKTTTTTTTTSTTTTTTTTTTSTTTTTTTTTPTSRITTLTSTRTILPSSAATTQTSATTTSSSTASTTGASALNHTQSTTSASLSYSETTSSIVSGSTLSSVSQSMNTTSQVMGPTSTDQASVALSAPSVSNMVFSTSVIQQPTSTDVSELYSLSSYSATLAPTSVSFSIIGNVESVSVQSLGIDSSSVSGQRSQSIQFEFSDVLIGSVQTSTISGGSGFSDKSPENQALVSSPVFLQYVTVAGAVVVIVGVLGGLYKLRQNRRKQQQTMWQSSKSVLTSQSFMLNRTIPLEITANTSSTVQH